jgi:hypothetical protein
LRHTRWLRAGPPQAAFGLNRPAPRTDMFVRPANDQQKADTKSGNETGGLDLLSLPLGGHHEEQLQPGAARRRDRPVRGKARPCPAHVLGRS